jgi:subtilisin family serine protease
MKVPAGFALLALLAFAAIPAAAPAVPSVRVVGPGSAALAPRPLGRPIPWARAATPPPPAAAFDGRSATIGVSRGVDGRELARSFGLRPVEWIPALRFVEVTGSARALTAVARLDDPRIRYVEPIGTGRVAHVRNDPLTYEIDPSTTRAYEWQFHAVGADQALNVAKGDPGILVGVVDTGISPVPDLAGKIADTLWDPGANSSGADVLGHGTFVSSIIAARNDDGKGLAGFCGACRIAAYKLSPHITDVQVAEGIEKLTDAHVRVINLSIVLDGSFGDVADALEYAKAAGVLVVAASGNAGVGTVAFPASYVQAASGAASAGLAVGASDAAGARASFSDYGAQLSLIAPGTYNTKCTVGILGALPASALDFREDNACEVTMTHADGARYAYASGTSFAAPEVAGVAALVWSLKPSLTSTQVAAVLEQTATRPAGTGWRPTVGWGVLDAAAAVESVSGRSSADSIGFARLRVSRPRWARSRVQASVEASWSDGTIVRIGATPACRITAGRAVVQATARIAAGLLTCAFTLPRARAGTQVAGTLSLSAPHAATVKAGFRFAIAATP